MGNEQTRTGVPSLQSIDPKYKLRREIPILRVRFYHMCDKLYLQWWYSKDGLTFTTAKMYVDHPGEKEPEEKDHQQVHILPRLSAPLITGYYVRENIDKWAWRIIDPQHRVTQQFHHYQILVDSITENTKLLFDIALIIGEYVSIEPIHTWVMGQETTEV